MDFGTAVGRAILVLVDALGAGLAAGVLTFLFVPPLFVPTWIEFALVVTGTVTVVFLAVALALAGVGSRPFPATRLVNGLFDRLPWWV